MKVIRTSGSIEDFRNHLSNNTEYNDLASNNKIIFLSIGNVSIESEKNYNLGDYIESSIHENTYCLYACKQYKKVALNITALRVSLKSLIFFKAIDLLSKTTFIISKNCFNNEKDEDNFLCTLKETCFDYINPKDFDELCNVVICDY